MLQTDNNAMTEVALALAMAFFAIFILAAVSMSQEARDHAAQAGHREQVHDLQITSETEGERSLKAQEVFVVYRDGRYYDADLQPFDFAAADQQAAYVVGVFPDLSMGDMISLRKQKNLPNLSITLLNNDWQKRVEALQ